MRTANLKTGFVVTLMAVCLVGGTAMAQVYTDPVGFVKVDVVKNGLTMVSVPLDAADKRLNGDPGCLGDMIKENLSPGPSGAEGDGVYKWDPTALPSGAYKTAFYMDAPQTSLDRTWFDPDAGAVSDLAFNAGEALWVQRYEKGDPTELITFLGWVPMELTKSVTFVNGLTMFAYPFPVTVALNDTKLNEVATKGPSSAEADSIYFWNAAATPPAYAVAFLFEGAPFDGKWFDPDLGVLSTLSFSPGAAMWFSRYPANTITWQVTRPY